ncbi:MAG: hypothetical protein K1X88_26185 [Nannocystaceae bacterium]|nr:hypothetical protein [Nannocystaceae bacterium]
MPPIDETRLQRVLGRFPWKRRKPRPGVLGVPPVSLRTRDGEQLWADPLELAEFSDPGPALLCIALSGDPTSRALVRSLVQHHARSRGVELPEAVPEITRAGVVVLDALFGQSGLDPAAEVGSHGIRELVTATWAIAAAETLRAA